MRRSVHVHVYAITEASHLCDRAGACLFSGGAGRGPVERLDIINLFAQGDRNYLTHYKHAGVDGFLSSTRREMLHPTRFTAHRAGIDNYTGRVVAVRRNSISVVGRRNA